VLCDDPLLDTVSVVPTTVPLTEAKSCSEWRRAATEPHDVMLVSLSVLHNGRRGFPLILWQYDSHSRVPPLFIIHTISPVDVVYLLLVKSSL
jgi:hypothetical protein